MLSPSSTSDASEQLDAVTVNILEGKMTAMEVFGEFEVPFYGIVLEVAQRHKS